MTQQFLMLLTAGPAADDVLTHYVDLPESHAGVRCQTCRTVMGYYHFPEVTVEVPSTVESTDLVAPRVMIVNAHCHNDPSGIHPWVMGCVQRVGFEAAQYLHQDDDDGD